MQLLFDNLAATILATTIFLMLASLTIQGQETQGRVQAAEIFRKQQVSFIKTLKRDMLSLTWVQDVKMQPDGSFTFFVRFSDQDADDSTKVVYKRQNAGVRDGVQFYRMQRLTCRPMPCSSPDPDGGSMSSLTEWSVKAYNNQQGVIAGSPADAAQIHLSFEAVRPFEKKKPFTRRQWEATYRPIMLQAESL